MAHQSTGELSKMAVNFQPFEPFVTRQTTENNKSNIYYNATHECIAPVDDSDYQDTVVLQNIVNADTINNRNDKSTDDLYHGCVTNNPLNNIIDKTEPFDHFNTHIKHNISLISDQIKTENDYSQANEEIPGTSAVGMGNVPLSNAKHLKTTSAICRTNSKTDLKRTNAIRRTTFKTQPPSTTRKDRNLFELFQNFDIVKEINKRKMRKQFSGTSIVHTNRGTDERISPQREVNSLLTNGSQATTSREERCYSVNINGSKIPEHQLNDSSGGGVIQTLEICETDYNLSKVDRHADNYSSSSINTGGSEANIHVWEPDYNLSNVENMCADSYSSNSISTGSSVTHMHQDKLDDMCNDKMKSNFTTTNIENPIHSRHRTSDDHTFNDNSTDSFLSSKHLSDYVDKGNSETTNAGTKQRRIEQTDIKIAITTLPTQYNSPVMSTNEQRVENIQRPEHENITNATRERTNGNIKTIKQHCNLRLPNNPKLKIILRPIDIFDVNQNRITRWDGNGRPLTHVKNNEKQSISKKGLTTKSMDNCIQRTEECILKTSNKYKHTRKRSFERFMDHTRVKQNGNDVDLHNTEYKQLKEKQETDPTYKEILTSLNNKPMKTTSYSEGKPIHASPANTNQKNISFNKLDQTNISETIIKSSKRRNVITLPENHPFHVSITKEPIRKGRNKKENHDQNVFNRKRILTTPNNEPISTNVTTPLSIKETFKDNGTTFVSIKDNIIDHETKLEEQQLHESDDLKIMPVLHRYKRYSGTHPCQVCKRIFSTKQVLYRHMKIHSGIKDYNCDVCDRSFIDNQVLKRHYRTHTGERPYTCNVCGKKFADNGNLRRHERVHTGHRPYQCVTCKKAFADLGSLSLHKLIHTGEKPHACKVRMLSLVSCLYLYINLYTHERHHTLVR